MDIFLLILAVMVSLYLVMALSLYHHLSALKAESLNIL